MSSPRATAVVSKPVSSDVLLVELLAGLGRSESFGRVHDWTIDGFDEIQVLSSAESTFMMTP